MTTAHRPTWSAATGTAAGQHGHWSSGGAISMAFSAKDLPSQLKMKERQIGQNTKAELATRDLKAELRERERKYELKKLEEKATDHQGQLLLQSKEAQLLLKEKGETLKMSKDYDDQDESDEGDESDQDSDEDDSDDDEDETLELMAELEAIKKEREQERIRKEQEDREAAARARQEEMEVGNPLLDDATSSGGSALMKRKWNHDVIFKNQARDEQASKKRFINDTIRNDFHRKFLSKYIG